MPTHDFQYPIGRFVFPPSALTVNERRAMMADLEEAPARMRTAVSGLTPAQLDTPYRPDGWTVRQVVHHLPDSHLNGYVRFKLALTEDVPTVKPYHEAKWAELADGRSALIEQSLMLLELLHARWLFLLQAMTSADFHRRLNHPEWDGPLSLDALLAQYAWHGRHHVAQVTDLRTRERW